MGRGDDSSRAFEHLFGGVKNTETEPQSITQSKVRITSYTILASNQTALGVPMVGIAALGDIYNRQKLIRAAARGAIAALLSHRKRT